jgi:hypothetical protein
MIDVSKFILYNVVDTCSLWNLLASKLLHSRATAAGVELCCTNFVVYECLYKKSADLAERAELQRRLKVQVDNGKIKSYAIDVEDLQDVDALRSRKRLSLGELSVLVFASKTKQAALTDDRGAQKLARTSIQLLVVQDTPHLVGWLYFQSLLGDDDIDSIKCELRQLSRNLSPRLEEYYVEAQRCRAVQMQQANMQADQ